VKRSSAHVDGLHAERPEKRRRLRELHDFILGIPLDDVDEGAAPFAIWEGSHEIMREAFHNGFKGSVQNLSHIFSSDVDFGFGLFGLIQRPHVHVALG
jgi:hypothetical protein